ncbi:GWxTD domain-containing protein [candidate division KSB1 bacterium]|nr:GWxTD domain-containing protein [candidate division KSB1 bacterium]
MPHKIHTFLYLLLVSATIVISTGESHARSDIFPLSSNSKPIYWTDCCFYRGSRGLTQIEISYSVAMDELTFKKAGQEMLSSFKCELTIKDDQNKTVYTNSKEKIIRAASVQETRDQSKGIVDLFVLDLQPGEYKFEFTLEDVYSEESSKISTKFAVPEFDSLLCMSTFQFASQVVRGNAQSPFNKGNQIVRPNVARSYPMNSSLLNFYFEIYNLQPVNEEITNQFALSYIITDIAGDTLFFIPQQLVPKPGASAAKVQTLDIRGLDIGEYLLTIVAVDQASEQAVSEEGRFWIRSPLKTTQVLPMSQDDIKRYRDQIKYFASRDDLKLFDELNETGKEAFLLNFWRSKDTNPETPENEFMMDCFSRIDYAEKHFKGREGGINSDMGRVFIIYGQPDEIENEPMEMNSKAYKIWYFYTSGTGKQSFVFVDKNNEGIYKLVHSTVEGEIKNEDWRQRELR